MFRLRRRSRFRPTAAAVGVPSAWRCAMTPTIEQEQVRRLRDGARLAPKRACYAAQGTLPATPASEEPPLGRFANTRKGR